MKNALINLCVTLGTVLFVFLLLEGYLYIRYENEYERLHERYADAEYELCTQGDPDLVYTLIPNRCGFNSMGFDDEEWQQEKSPGVFRIVLIGDSVAQGQGVTRKARFSSVFEKLWNSSPSRPQIEVLNLAISGYSTTQQLTVLQETAMALGPDLIWWSYVLNDPAHPLFHDGNGELGRYYYRPTWRGGHYIYEKLFEARENHLRKSCGQEFHEVLHCVYREQVVINLAEIGHVVGDTPVLFTIHPLLPQNSTFPDYPHARIHQDLADMARGFGYTTIDLSLAFEGRRGESLAVDNGQPWYDPWHPNAEGHALKAEYLRAEIEKMGLLSPGSTQKR